MRPKLRRRPPRGKSPLGQGTAAEQPAVLGQQDPLLPAGAAHEVGVLGVDLPRNAEAQQAAGRRTQADVQQEARGTVPGGSEPFPGTEREDGPQDVTVRTCGVEELLVVDATTPEA